MATTSKLNLNIPVVGDTVGNTISALASNMQILDDNIVVLTTINNLLSALELQLKNKIETADNSLSTEINNTKGLLEGLIQNHINHVNAHPSQNISYTGTIEGVNNVRNALNALNDRVKSIITQTNLNPNKDQEVVDARHSTYKQVVYDTLSDRFNAIETGKHYKWIEQKAVAMGNKTITLTNPYFSGQFLIIRDRETGTNWYSPENYSINSQTITLTDPLPQTLNFEIINLG